MNLTTRRLRRAALGAVALPLLWASTAAAAPSIDATPTWGLASGQSVTVTGAGIPLDTGTPPGTGLYAAQIAIVDGTTFYANNANSKFVRRTPSASPNQAKLEDDGTFSTSVTVVGSFTSGATTVDCAAANTECLVASWPAHGNPNAGNLIDSVAIEFGPGIRATPTTDLDPAGQAVSVTGAGIPLDTGTPPGTGLYAAQIAIVDGTTYHAYNAGSKFIRTGGSTPDTKLQADGTFSTSVTVVGSFTSGATTVDCAAANTECLVASWPAHGFPNAGNLIDSVPIAFKAAGGGDPGGGDPGGTPRPSVSFSPSSGLPADAPTTVTVNGSGFSATANGGVGVYLVYGPRPADFATNQGVYAPGAKWIRPGGAGGSQADLTPAGTFSTTLTLYPSYVAGSGEAVNCTQVQCYVQTFAAHGSPDRSFDTAVPVTFAGAAADPAPVDPPADPLPVAPPVVTPPAPGPGTPAPAAPRLTRVDLARDGTLRFTASEAGTVKVKVLRRVVTGKGKNRKARWRVVERVEVPVEAGGRVAHELELVKPGRYRAQLTFVGERGARATASTGVKVKPAQKAKAGKDGRKAKAGKGKAGRKAKDGKAGRKASDGKAGRKAKAGRAGGKGERAARK